uniref:Uncharacterized protein n=1 Tax=Rhizophora mucronata TaxID=61149 RepID=A0A2P2PKA2_RHIMU
MDFGQWSDEPWGISRGTKSKWKLDAVSETQRLSYRRQEVLLQFRHQREKAVSCARNIPIWQFGR